MYILEKVLNCKPEAVNPSISMYSITRNSSEIKKVSEYFYNLAEMYLNMSELYNMVETELVIYRQIRDFLKYGFPMESAARESFIDLMVIHLSTWRFDDSIQRFEIIQIFESIAKDITE